MTIQTFLFYYLNTLNEILFKILIEALNVFILQWRVFVFFILFIF